MTSGETAAAACLVGAAQEVITPPLGTSLCGYFHDRKAEGVRDDLFARAVVFEADGVRLAVVSCDLIGVTAEVVDAAKQAIEAACGIAPSHVLVGATHTHTGPEVRREGLLPVCEPWLEELPTRIATAVERAAGRLAPCTLRAGATHDVNGYSFNRLWRLKDGSEVFGKGRAPADQLVGPAGPIDPELQTLSAVDEQGRLVALLVNFACHPDVVSGCLVSADWPGVLGRTIAAVYGEHVVTAFLQGACGDINHVVHDPTLLPRTGPDRAELMGRAFAGAAMLAMERAEPMTEIRLDARLQIVPMPCYTREERLRAEVEALRAKPKRTDQEDCLIARFDAWAFDGQTADVPIQAMRIGDVALAGLPAEVFVRLGFELKHFSPAERTFVVERANASPTGYAPTTDQAERGAYGTKPILSRRLVSDGGRRMIDAAGVLLHELF